MQRERRLSSRGDVLQGVPKIQSGGKPVQGLPVREREAKEAVRNKNRATKVGARAGDYRALLARANTLADTLDKIICGGKVDWDEAEEAYDWVRELNART